MDYDTILIGTSPVLLAEGIRRHVSNCESKTLFLESAAEYGGAWKSVKLSSGRQIEMACHLIEPYRGVYRFLEYCSGEKFVPLVPQPTRMSITGSHTKYSSRVLIVRNIIRSLILIISCQARICALAITDRSGKKTIHLKRKSQVHLLRVKAFIRFRLPTLHRSIEVEAPINGFSQFTESLLANCRSHGIEFQNVTVTELKHNGKNWEVRTNGGTSYIAKRIIATQSASLQVVNQNHFQYSSSTVTEFRNVVVVISQNQCLKAIPYCYIAGNPFVTRFSRIDGLKEDENRNQITYLVQLSKRSSNDRDDEYKAIDALIKAGVIDSKSAVKALEFSDVSLIGSTKTAMLPPSHHKNQITILTSLNDLAFSVVCHFPRVKHSNFFDNRVS